MIKNVVGYCRVSTDNQVGEDKFGIEAQKNEIMSFCEKNGYTIAEWYIEEAVSGHEDAEHRPELAKILNGDITNPPIQAMVVAKNDRLSRNVENYFAYRYLLKRRNIEVISVQEDFGSAGMFKPMLEAMSAAFAEIERAFIAMRMSDGRAAKASKGGYSGGKAPYGYKSKKGSKKLTLCEEEVPLVRRIFELNEQGSTLKGICDTLKAEGYKTRKGGDFQISTVQYILKNRKTYEGYYKYGKDGEWVKGVHEPILKEEQD